MKQRLAELRDRYDEAILRLIDETVHGVPSDGTSLGEMCDYHMRTGGKRLRAIVPLAIAETLGTDAEKVLPFAAACELLHNATLVHDDLQDGDETRRGEPTIWKKYSAERAINLGDAMLHWPIVLIDRLDCSDELYRRLSQRLSRETLRVIDGQDREFLLSTQSEATWESYFRMVEGKTGGLFVLPAAGGAELAGASPDLVRATEKAAAELGVLFQIQDDVLDLYGDKGRDHRGMDICEGKISALVVHYLSNAPAEKAEWLRNLLDAPREEVTIDDIDRVAEEFRAEGSLDAALEEIETRRRRALDDPAFDDAPELRNLMGGIADLFLKPIDHVIHARSAS
jgi:geranylgeranyl pyrophosphate synthase